MASVVATITPLNLVAATMPIAFEQLIAQHGAAIARVAHAYERNPALREELQQEILLAIWQALSHFRGEASLKTFCLKIAHHRAVNHVINERSRPAHAELHEQLIDHHHGPAQQAQLQQHSERLLALVQQLPLPSKELVLLALEGVSHQEIAEIMGLTVNVVAVRLSRLRTQIQQQLEFAR